MINPTLPLKEENAEHTCIIVLDFHSKPSALAGKIFRLLAGESMDVSHGTGATRATISRLNKAVLAATTSDRSNWWPISQYPDISASFKPMALSLLEQEFSNSSLFILDEPHFRRTAAFWLDALTSIGVRPIVLVAMPSCPAKILPEAQFFWLRHILDAEAASRNMARVFFTMDDLNDNWRHIVSRIAQLSGTEWPCPPERISAVIDELISQELISSRSTPEDQSGGSSTSAWVNEISEILRRADEGESDTDYARIDHIREVLDEAAKLLGPLVFPDGHRQQINFLTAEMGEAREKMKHLVAEQELYKARSQEQVREIVTLTNIVHAKDSAWESRFINMLLRLPAWRFLPETLRIHQKMAIIRRSGEFDAAWYTKRYKDVAESKIDPLSHYVRHGMQEGRLPHDRTKRRGHQKGCAE